MYLQYPTSDELKVTYQATVYHRFAQRDPVALLNLPALSPLSPVRLGSPVVAFALNLAFPPDILSRLVVVDISPAVGSISPEFRRYIDAMKEIDHANVKTKKECEEILKKYESDASTRAFLLHNLIAPAKGEPLKFRIPLSAIADAIDGIGEFPYTPGKETWNGATLFVKGAKSK
ncbi:Alpha beta-hydrolase [Rhizoctonia solani]|uniref:Alpha beta-hydrolase n=1 Tax=Rhizoctonia solani TaxID=456999 RepID=A0A8H7I796_9AGAM|nr:Alpha beta-hydrolase [Rhizoctonia solani]